MNHLPSYLDAYASDIGIAHIIELREYNPRYKEVFSKEQERLKSAFDRLPVFLHHVGSTSVEGLCAKPIIDMLLIYSEDIDFDDVKDTLVRAGYFFREDLLPDRTYFVLENGNGVRFFSISVFKEGDIRADGILTFRDNLRKDSTLVTKYADIKRELSTETADRKKYTAKKTEFVNRYSQILQ